jgi:hypothetical protein
MGLWGDEVQFLNISALPDLDSILSFLALHESHPPLFYIIGHMSAKLFMGPAAMSVFVLCCSMATILMAAWLAGLSGVRGAGWLAALLVALSVPLSLVSVQIRPYALISTLVLLSMVALIRGCSRPGHYWRAVWAAVTLLLLYLHHIAIPFVAAQVLVLILWAWRGHRWRDLGGWIPWAGVVLVLAIPDLKLLMQQERRTGYLAGRPGAFDGPLRQAAWLAVSFPAEVLLPMIICVGSFLRSRSWARSQQVNRLPKAQLVVSATFLATWLTMVVASYRHNVLVDHVVLAFAPLGLCGVGIVVARLAQSPRRVLAVVLTQAVIASMVLSATGSVGAIKSNTEDMARLVSAERLESDFVLLAPRVPGATFNRYLRRPISQIDYPDAGATSLYEFDNSLARVSDPAAWAAAVDSIRLVHRSGRRLWFMYPARWPLELPAGSGSAPDSSSGLVVAKAITARLHVALVAEFGRPSRIVRAMPAPWSMEQMSLEMFGPRSAAAVGGSQVLHTNDGRTQ